MSRRILWLEVLLVGLMFLSPGWDSSVEGHSEWPLQNLKGNIRIERPVRHGNLTIFPLSLVRAGDRTRYLTLDEAVKRGDLRITELKDERVSEVYVENTSRHYVFLMAGELLTGCKQDRMVSDDCLLPPSSGRMRLRVYCTEHGRWTAESRHFDSGGEAVHPMMRQLAKATRSQERVWAEVEGKREQLGVAPSETQAFKKVVADKDVQERIKPYLDRLNKVPRLGRNVCGVVATTGERIIVCDLFSNHQLFDKMWPKLLRSYVLDVLDAPTGRGSVSKREVENFLRRAGDAQHRTGETDGVGQALEIDSRTLFGSALIHKENVVHLDLFPKEIGRMGEPGLNLDYRRHRGE